MTQSALMRQSNLCGLAPQRKHSPRSASTVLPICRRAHRHNGEVSGMQRSSAMHSVQGERGSTGVATPDEPARKETSPSAATTSDIASTPVASSEDSGTEQLPEKLTTWSYGKTKDPGLVTYYLVAAFAVPLLLIIIPFLPFNR
ncbi:hypothetical protein HaLaN_21585, partial [Haematococcus lacustris]